MSSKKKQKDKVEETKITEPEEPVTEEKEEETPNPDTDTSKDNDSVKDKVEETPTEDEEKEEVIDPRVEAMLNMNRNRKILEKDKQAKIYSAMATIQVVRS